MKNIVPLAFTWPPVLEQVIIVGDGVRTLYFATCRAAAPKLLPYFGERICNFV
jgi:hypothetical protein